MLQRDKENREIRKLGRERLKEIRRKTQEKEEADNKYLFKVQLIVVVCVLLVLFLIWLVF